MKSLFLKQSCNELSPKQQYNGIDIVKFLCAVMVCIIHITPFQTDFLGLNHLNFWLQQYICRIAVPFYFTASGFLLFRKADDFFLSKNTIKEYCFKILRLLGTWTFLLFVGGSNQLWYLGALVLAVVILNFLIKKRLSMRFIAIISLTLFGIGLLGDSYHGIIEPLKSYFIPKLFVEGYETIFSTTRNGLFFGLVFVFLGALFAQKHIVINHIVVIIGLIVSLAIMFVEVFLLKYYSQPKDFNMIASLLPVTFFLFYIATHLSLKDRPIYCSLRIIGMMIFFTHLFVNCFVGLAIEITKNKTGIDFSAFRFIITIVFTTLLAILIERLSKKEKFSWLKYLYS